jgi:hypothetical protein
MGKLFLLSLLACVAEAAEYEELPQGVISNLTAAEMEKVMALNRQFLQEFESESYVSTVEVSFGIMKCSQKCSEWCWATSATMAASAFGAGGKCIENEAKVAGHVLHTTCSASDPCTSACNKASNLKGAADGIRFLSNKQYQVQQSSLSNSALDNAVKKGPVLVEVHWESGRGGHIVTLYGASGGNYKIHDPHGEDHTVSYDGILKYKGHSGRYGDWTGTAHVGNGMPVVV